MDVIFDWNLGNMIYNGLITLRLCGFPFAKIEVVSLSTWLATAAPSSSQCSVLEAGNVGRGSRMGEALAQVRDVLAPAAQQHGHDGVGDVWRHG